MEIGPASRGRVQRVQKVQKVQRVVVSPSAMSMKSALRDISHPAVIAFSTLLHNPRPARKRRAEPLPAKGGRPLLLSGIQLPSVKEALIKSLFAFILEFLCNARNGATRIASYLRSLMTKQCIKILIKANSMN